MMEPPLLSEEERRLLREYRITKVPTRRYNGECSNINKKEQSVSTVAAEQPSRIKTTSASNPQSGCSSASSSSSSGSSTTSSSSLSTRLAVVQTAQKGQSLTPTSNNHLQAKQQKYASPRDQSQSLQKLHSHQLDQNNHHRSHHKHHNHHHHGHKHNGRHHHHNHNLHHHHHHHHHSNHHRSHHHHHHRRKHKSITPTQELNDDDLSKMLELASNMSYLKLVSLVEPTNHIKGNQCNNKTNETRNQASSDSDLKNEPTTGLNGHDSKTKHNQNKTEDNQNAFTKDLSIDCNTSVASMSPPSTALSNISSIKQNSAQMPYIFEQVDYIKKIAIRRKALKKLKKGSKTKASSISPPTTAAV